MNRIRAAHARHLTRDLAAWRGGPINFLGHSPEARRLQSVAAMQASGDAQRHAVLDMLRAALAVATLDSATALRSALMTA